MSNVEHPSHYNNGNYECIDVMQDVFGEEALKHFALLNAFKYVWRAEHKNGVEDIDKAIWYLNLVKELNACEMGRKAAKDRSRETSSEADCHSLRVSTRS